ncbi:MAG TPA: hypothetical protein VJA23_04475 [Candidatus Nanoarchaeia archaeon]|nr:hypothetical protein [Candidatus Nanoarchaeia archaeon]
MLSAKSTDGKLYVAGSITDPKSRDYSCIYPSCGEAVSHVSRHQRSGMDWVTEHFRHGAKASHALRKMSGKQGEALEFILSQLAKEYEMEIFTDQIYPTSRGDIATDILAREHLPGGTHQDTLIQVESDTFNFNDYRALDSALTGKNIALMMVLCAEGTNNPNGAFFRDEYRRASGKTVKNLGKNEKALYDQNGINVYYDHDQPSLLIVQFNEYEETLREDIVRGGYRIKEAGDTQTFELKKEPEIKFRYADRFKFRIYQNNQGQLIVRPRKLVINDFFGKEALAKERGDAEKVGDFEERVAIMLDSCNEQELVRLTQKYGAERLGGYAR